MTTKPDPKSIPYKILQNYLGRECNPRKIFLPNKFLQDSYKTVAYAGSVYKESVV